MSSSPENGTPSVELRARLEDVDTRIHDALIERAALTSNDLATRLPLFRPELDADQVRQMVERHAGTLPLAALEHIWRDFICACAGLSSDTAIHLDGSAELIEMFDLARYYFGFSVELVPCSDASDVVGAVSETTGDLGIIALNDRAELPWWRGLSEAGARVRARLPFVVLDERPADLPALVVARDDSLVDDADIAVYDARWSDRLPGKLMDQGIEVLSFFRSANGVDALLAISGELSEDDVKTACESAGALPDVLRCVGGYSAPIDGESDQEDGFDTVASPNSGEGEPRE